MPQFVGCPNGVYAMLLRCWDEDPSKRPSFDDIATFFEIEVGGHRGSIDDATNVAALIEASILASTAARDGMVASGAPINELPPPVPPRGTAPALPPREPWRDSVAIGLGYLAVDGIKDHDTTDQRAPVVPQRAPSATQLPAMSKKVARNATEERCGVCNAKIAFCCCNVTRRPTPHEVTRPISRVVRGHGHDPAEKVLAEDETRL